jgi:Mrp family chromosome partitioning ATPase
MIMIHDLLHGRSGGAPANPDAESIHAAAAKKMAGRPRPRRALPFLNLPRQWAAELQKVAYQLSTPGKGEAARPMSFVFSSVAEGAGTTTVSYFFAYVLAADSAHRNILFLDFDPEINKPAVTGAKATVFVGQEDFSALLAEPDTNLDVISVRVGPDRSTASSTQWFHDFMATAHETYDIIVVDAPPIAFTPMAYAPARASDGVVLVLRCGESRYPAINTLVRDLEAMGIDSMGAVLNKRQYPKPKALLNLL